eukprot:CAMPEP_0174893500 /NCGR_PEP_ID=MMETSP0167-20121228/8319_1 /TAXON_ID=38298 /ORGANISM="Rhodella maculata, Strain CCMP736" /LENGTH=54 /DNA_ID=CAMNT_0016132321 /DNA_START=506 /DNA_END=667 /DNA_ORIENTATION=+
MAEFLESKRGKLDLTSRDEYPAALPDTAIHRIFDFLNIDARTSNGKASGIFNAW